MATASEIGAMRRAIALSACGIGTTSPNPPVGCVVLGSNGEVVGEGYHERKGDAHAETNALAAAGGLAEGGTAVVTLEPCNHDGLTPACRQVLIDAKVARVVIALLDPTSRGEGGAARLRAAGIDVEVGVLEDEATTVLGPWLAALERRRPVITWPYVAQVGGIVPAPADLEDFRLLRLDADALFHADGSTSEAVPGSHGAGMLRLLSFAEDADRVVVASSMYEGGVRRLLLDGGLALAQPFLDLGLVDRVYAYLPHGRASRTARDLHPWPLVPFGYKIVGVTRLDRFVRVEALREAGLRPPAM